MITIICMTLLGILLAIQDYMYKEVYSITCYAYLFLLAIFIGSVTGYNSLYFIANITLAMVSVVILNFKNELGDINLIDLIMIANTIIVILLLKTVENSNMILLPLLIIMALYIGIEKLARQKIGEKIPMLTVCCPLISTYSIWFYLVN